MRTISSLLVVAFLACGGGAAPQRVPTEVPSSTSTPSAPPSASASTIADAADASASADPSPNASASASAVASASASASPPTPTWPALTTLVERCPKPKPRTKQGPPAPCGPNRMCGNHTQAPPSIREMSCRFGGPLPYEVIRRVVRQNYGRFRLCYESGLRNDPQLEGTVEVMLDIRADGTVRMANQAGGTLKDSGTRACVARNFETLTFPEADGVTRAVMTFDFYVP